MELLEIEARVAAGAAWLDGQAPGWVDRIALPSLNINSPFSCVLGQVFERESRTAAGYHFALETKMGDDKALAIALGFNALEGGYEDRLAEMPVLADAWRRLVTAKRAELALVA